MANLNFFIDFILSLLFSVEPHKQLGSTGGHFPILVQL